MALPLLSLLSLLFGAAVVLMGAGLLARTASERRTAGAMAARPVTPVGDLRPGDGPVAVEGVAREREGTVEAPVHGTRGVVVHTALAEYVSGGGAEAALGDVGSQEGRWDYRRETVESRPFALEEAGHTVRVDLPAEAAVDLDGGRTVDIEPGDAPPAAVAPALAALDVPAVESDTPRRLRQSVLEPGGDACVLAPGVEDGRDGPALAAAGRPGEFVLTTRGLGAYAERRAGSGLGRYLLGAMLLLIGGFLAVPPLLTLLGVGLG